MSFEDLIDVTRGRLSMDASVHCRAGGPLMTTSFPTYVSGSTSLVDV